MGIESGKDGLGAAPGQDGEQARTGPDAGEPQGPEEFASTCIVRRLVFDPGRRLVGEVVEGGDGVSRRIGRVAGIGPAGISRVRETTMAAMSAGVKVASQVPGIPEITGGSETPLQ